MKSDTPDPHGVIDTNAGLKALLDKLGRPDLLALDTEFHSERRYRPQLLLVQLAVRGGPVWTIDPCAVDLTLLAPILTGATWLVHGGSWDVSLLSKATGARPGALLDTQLLAAFAGMSFPARLSSLARDVLDEQVDKGATLSDWSRRPLSPEQLAYARADVSVLFALADALLERVDALDATVPTRAGRRWALQAGMELVEAALAPSSPNHHWRQLDIAPGFDAPTRCALHTLYTWRDAEAARRNSPPHFVLSPGIALDLARRRPTDLAGLRANRRIPQGLLKRHGATLLRLLDESTRLSEIPPPVVRGPAARIALVQALREVEGERMGIAPKLLLPPEMIHRAAGEGAVAITGWRKEAISEAIGDLLAGRSTLRVYEDHVVVEQIGQTGHATSC